MHHYTKLALLVIALATGGGMAYAVTSQQAGMENDGLAIGKAKVSLTQAITTAEQQMGGKASRAEFEHEKGSWVFDVEVVKGDKVFDVRIDADKGTVLSSKEDKAEHDHHEHND
jgi:uncharacterized membrane protein YkoI